jgi:hypothetical protein
VFDPSAAASIASAVLAGLTLFLDELRRRGSAREPSDVLRNSLLQLEEFLEQWASQAEATNALAHEWARGLPDSREPALSALVESMWTQSMWLANVETSLKTPSDVIAPHSARDLGGEATLQRLLRVYAPDFHELLVVFSQRKAQLVAMADELDRRRLAGSRDAVDDYLAELDEAAANLRLARRRLGDFISTTFPIGPAR